MLKYRWITIKSISEVNNIIYKTNNDMMSIVTITNNGSLERTGQKNKKCF